MGSLESPANPTYGQRLLPNLVDERSKERPNDIYALVPKSAQFNDGMLEITYATLARTIDAVAFWLEQTLGKSTTFETIAYIGSGELLYQLHFWGCY